MSGAALIMMALSRGLITSVTVGNNGLGTSYGYNIQSTPYGSIGRNTFDGKTIAQVLVMTSDGGSTWSYVFSLAGDVADTEAAFHSITLGGDASSGELLRSAATYADNGDFVTWTWSGASDPSADSSWTLTVR